MNIALIFIEMAHLAGFSSVCRRGSDLTMEDRASFVSSTRRQTVMAFVALLALPLVLSPCLIA